MSEKLMVLQYPDRSVTIVKAVEARRPVAFDEKTGVTTLEDDETYYARVFAHTIAMNPQYKGLQYFVILASDIPEKRDKRDKWRYKDGKVVVEE